MKNKIERTILSVFLLAFVIIGCIGSKAFLKIGPVLKAAGAEISEGVRPEKSEVKQAEKKTDAETAEASAETKASEKDQERKETEKASADRSDEEKTDPTLAELTQGFSEDLFFKDQMVQQNGAFSKQLGMADLYNQDNAYILDNGFVVGVYSQADPGYEIEQVAAFRDFLEANGISLLYVNEPVKYTDDEAVTEELGIPTYINENADRLLAGLAQAGVPTLDIRDTFSGTDPFSWFYRTDHHWNTSAGKECARAICEKLNQDFGYGIDLSLYDDANLIYTLYEDAWLGEQGRKLGESYTGMENYTLIVPAYDTLFTISLEDGERTGTFDEVLVNQDIFLPQNNYDIYNGPSWHYAYRGNEGPITNEYVENGNILVLGDSYDTVTNAFLSLGVHSVHGIVLRDFKKGSIRDYILENGFDTVIIAYTEFMIGAHNDEDSANYEMFSFK